MICEKLVSSALEDLKRGPIYSEYIAEKFIVINVANRSVCKFKKISDLLKIKYKKIKKIKG